VFLNTIKSKLVFILIVALVGMATICSISLFSDKESLLEDRKSNTRNLVEVAAGIVSHYHDLQVKGEMSEADAQAAALSVLKELRYNKKEYFWVNDMTPTLLMHPITLQRVGKNVSEVKEAGGKNIFVEYVNVVKANGAGFVEYQWPKPGSSESVRKVAYVIGYQPWGWVIGSGIYIDDVDQVFYSNAIALGTISLGISAAIAALLFLIIRNITGPIDRIRDVILSIETSNDLSRRVLIKGKNEINDIGHSFNSMVESFQSLIKDVVASANAVSNLTEHLAHSASLVATSSRDQSEASANMAASMEEVNSSIEQVASNARDANKIAERAGESSNRGLLIVEEAATEMTKVADSVKDSAQHVQTLGEQSHQISSIVNVIKEIADQTNLLALNAAIEAARAGEQGRGFAVVADEVRKLAERTSQSTREISTMISSIQSGTETAVESMRDGSDRVKGGVELAQQAGASMADIREGASHVLAAVAEITHALQEQNVATQHVVNNVERIAAMAEQNSTETDEIEKTTVSLKGLASKLDELVARFKL
jgi:methyl-accepting chemotaxis protein